MDKERRENLIRKFDSGNLTNEELRMLEKALEEGEISLDEIESLSVLNKKINFSIPEPDSELRTQFYQNLEQEKARLMRGNFLSGLGMWLKDLGWQPSTIRMAYSLMLIVVGVAFGLWISGVGKSDQKIDALTAEVNQMKEMMMLTLLKEPVAIERLKAVNLVMDAPRVDNKVIEALLNTLNSDENVNVRLATIEVLIKYASNPIARKGLVESIPNQTSATIQYALAEAMVVIGEKGSVDNLRDLLKSKDLDQGVKDKIEESIQKLI